MDPEISKAVIDSALIKEIFNIYSNKLSLENFKNNYLEENNLIEVYNNNKTKEKANIDIKINLHLFNFKI